MTASQYALPGVTAGSLDLGPFVIAVVTGGWGQDIDNDGLLGLNVLKNYRLVWTMQTSKPIFSISFRRPPVRRD